MTDANPEQDSAGRAAQARSDAITKALEEVSGGDSGAAAAPVDEPSTPEPEGDAPTDQDFEADAGDTPEEASPSDSEGEPAVDEPADEDTAQLDAPRDLPKELKERFSGLDDAAKQFVIDREREFNKRYTEKAKEASDHRNFAESVRGQFTDADRQQMQAAGLSESEAVGQLLQLNRQFNEDPTKYVAGILNASRDPAGFVRAALQHLQISPEQAFQAQDQTQANSETGQPDEDMFADDPYLQQLQAKFNGEFQTLQQKLEEERKHREQLEQAYYGERQSRQQRAIQTVQGQIDEFKAETDDSGNAKWPHFDALESRMTRLLRDPDFNQRSFSSMREKLEAAYDDALWSDPNLRQEALEREAEKRAEQRQKQAQSQRRQAARSVKPGAGAEGQTTLTKPTRAQAIEQAMRQHGLPVE